MGSVWFGTKAHMQWITAPAVNVGAGKSGWQGAANFMNGGAWTRRSKASAKNFNFTWNMKHRDDIQPIIDYVDGMYGPGYMYYCNPFAMDKNVLPAWLAAPYINAYDGPWYFSGARPALFNTGVSTRGFPLEAANYTLNTNVGKLFPKVFIPIPPGHTLHLAAFGQKLNAGTGGVQVIPEVSAAASGTPVLLTLLNPATSTSMFSNSFSGDDFIGVSITMIPGTGTKLLLNGLMAQVLPNGRVAKEERFISGQGQSGMHFTEQPSVTEYSAALDRVGATVNLVETEAWSWS